jgi:hypothetical protein
VVIGVYYVVVDVLWLGLYLIAACVIAFALAITRLRRDRSRFANPPRHS